MRRRTIPLPLDYHPDEDNGKFALELFLDEKEPPDSVYIDVREGRLVAVGTWKYQEAER